MLLAPICVGWLVYFIHHISNAISVNHIVDRIRRETEQVIDELMPEPRRPAQFEGPVGAFPEALEHLIPSRRSGYIRFIDIERLRSLANDYRVCLRVERRVGHFVPEGVGLVRVSRGDRIGIVQIVDIGLRAISPAVNDPTTAISCVDQLSCILIRWAARAPTRSYFYDPPHVLRVVIPWINFNGLLDLAFEQIRHYAVADAAVSLRLMRALDDIASTVEDPVIRLRLLDRGRRLFAGCAGHLQEDDLARLRERLSLLEDGIAHENQT